MWNFLKEMHTFQAFFLSLLVIAALPAEAGLELWQEAVTKVETCQDYSVVCSYSGPRGNFKMTCLANSAEKVKTVVMAGSDRHVGTTSVFDKEMAPGQVLLRFPSGSVVLRKVEHDQVKDTPLFISVYHHLLGRLRSADKPRPVQEAGPLEGFEFDLPSGSTMNVWVNPQAEIVRARAEMGKNVMEEAFFENLEWETGRPVSFD